VTCKPLVFKGLVWLFVCLTVHHARQAYQVTVPYILNLNGQLQGLAMPPPTYPLKGRMGSRYGR